MYPYYWPLYKAGGPVQSLYNLAAAGRETCDFYFVSRSADIDGSVPDQPLPPDQWSAGPNGEKIFPTRTLPPWFLDRLLKQLQPDVVFVNGIFHWDTTLLGLLVSQRRHLDVVISPRGMLQPWALSRGAAKKKIYLRLLKWLLNGRQQWHVTSAQEAAEVRQHFGNQKIHVAPNVPRALTHYQPLAFASPGQPVRLVFLSLINPNKNLHRIIDAVCAAGGRLTLDIYGPVIDNSYWQMCQRQMGASPCIRYRGPVSPWQVPETLQRYHFFVLPTEGENFGHAIFDALAAGVPVVISTHTPWQEVDMRQAGFYFLNETPDGIAQVLQQVATLSPDSYAQMREGAFAYAEDYLRSRDVAREYSFLSSATMRR